MIDLTALCSILDSLEIPWANQSWPGFSAPDPPYIVLAAGYGETAWADNMAYASWMPYDIALYTKSRDYALEQRIKDALSDAGVPWTLAVTSLDSEKLIEAAFAVNVSD